MRILAGTLVAAAVAVVAMLLLARGPSTPRSGQLTVHAALTPPVVQFGDRVTARVDVTAVRSAHVDASFVPLTQLSKPKVVRDAEGVHWSVQLSCLDQVCAAPRKVFTLPDAHVNGRLMMWPRLVVRGRVTKEDLARDPPPLVANTDPGRASYRVAPGRAAWLLEALALALALGGVALLGRQAALVARARRERARRLTQLERALVLARESEQRDAVDRRRAVGLVARLLSRRGEELAAPAADLAWAPREPDPDEIEQLVRDVERTR